MKRSHKKSKADFHLHCQVKGDADKPVLVLVHGFLSSNLQWALNETALLAHFRLFMIELWGHGNSPVPQDNREYSVERYVQELETIRQQHGVKRWGLVGQSYGAAIVMHYARFKPEHCSGIVVTNSLSAFSPPGSIKPGISYEEFIRQHGVKALPIHPSFSKSLPETLKQKMIIQADKVDSEAAIAGLNLRNQLSILPFTGELPRTLVTNGVYEKAFQPIVKAAKEQWQGLEVVDLKGGHSININCANDFDEAVINFFQDCSAKSTN